MAISEPFALLDTYELRHLPAHLDATSRYQDLFRLLDLETNDKRNAWYRAKLSLDPSGGAYLADQALAFAAAESIHKQSAERGEPLPLLGRELRCAVTIASIRSFYGSIPAALLSALVNQGVWPAELALAGLSMRPDVQQRIEELVILAPSLPPSARTLALAEGVEAARRILDDQQRAAALALLAPHMEEPARSETLKAALAAVQKIFLTKAGRIERNEQTRAEALMALAPKLTETLLGVTLVDIRNISVEQHRVELLAALAPHLTVTHCWRPPWRRCGESVRNGIESRRWPSWLPLCPTDAERTPNPGPGRRPQNLRSTSAVSVFDEASREPRRPPD